MGFVSATASPLQVGDSPCRGARAGRRGVEGAQLRPLGSLLDWEKLVIASLHLANCHKRVGYVGELVEGHDRHQCGIQWAFRATIGFRFNAFDDDRGDQGKFITIHGDWLSNEGCGVGWRIAPPRSR